MDDDATSYFELSRGIAAAVAAGVIGLSLGRIISLATLVFAGVGVAGLLIALWLACRNDPVARTAVETEVVSGVDIRLVQNSFGSPLLVVAVILVATVLLRDSARSEVGEGTSPPMAVS